MDEGSGLAASMIQPYSVIDWVNSHAKSELVEDILNRSCLRTEYRIQFAEMGKGR
jgi:hypothetical protein